MTIDFVSLIFTWLLPLTVSCAVTSGQSHNFTNVMTGDDQLTTQETSILNPLSQVSGRTMTQSIIADVNPKEEKNTKPSKPSLQTTQTTPAKTFLLNIQTSATPTNPISSQLISSTIDMKSMTEATMVVTSQASNTATRVPPTLSSSTQSQDTGKMSNSQLTSDKSTHPSTRPTQSTTLISTTTRSTKPVENKCTSTSPVMGDDATQPSSLYKTSMVMTQTPFIHITKSKKGTNHSKAVAGLIGGALVLMMAGFLVIYIKKRKLQRQKITTRDWAGPSPFLEDGADNGQVTLRPSNQISLSSFLSQRLSKRLSLLPETDEELEDMTPGTTFGDKHQGSTFSREVDGNPANPAILSGTV